MQLPAGWGARARTRDPRVQAAELVAAVVVAGVVELVGQLVHRDGFARVTLPPAEKVPRAQAEQLAPA